MVARLFELSGRRDKLSFQHHAEVCALLPAQQDRRLDQAEGEGWSRNELRRHLRAESPRRRSETIRLGSTPNAPPAGQRRRGKLDRISAPGSSTPSIRPRRASSGRRTETPASSADVGEVEED